MGAVKRLTTLTSTVERLQRFFAVNKRVCERIEQHLPQAHPDIDLLYEQVVARHMNSGLDRLVVDVGGGKDCPLSQYRRPELRTRIVAVDVSEDELRSNRDVDEKRVANVVEQLPFEENEVDLIVSRSVLEHLESVERFIEQSAHVLKRDGYFIHVFASKFAPATLVNQLLPQPVSKRIVDFFRPESAGYLGFPAYYDNCYYTGMTKLLEEHGFDLVGVHTNYYQSPYFAFLVPLFLVSAAYELVVRSLGVVDLAARLLMVARKR